MNSLKFPIVQHPDIGFKKFIICCKGNGFRLAHLWDPKALEPRYYDN